MMPSKFQLLVLSVCFLFAGMAVASEGAHSDPIAPVLLGVTGVLFFAILGRFVARSMGQPTVLGELVMGILLGNLIYVLGGDFILVLR